jgi:hypothetical protein
MSTLKYTLIYLSLCLINHHAHAQSVCISLFNETPVKGVVVSALKGTYRVFGDSSFIMNQSEKDAMYISMFDHRLLLRNSRQPIGNFANIRFEAVDTNAVIRLNPVNPNKEPRQYNDNLLVSVAFERVLLINEVQQSNYIAGVVDAEAGPNAEPEFTTPAI